MMESASDPATTSSSWSPDPSCFTSDHLRPYCDSLGQATDESGCAALAEELSFQIRLIVQNAQRFAMHSRRARVASSDVDMALRLANFPALYSLSLDADVAFKQVSGGGGRELHFVEDKELELADLLNQPMPKVPLGVSLRAHWLAIDGTQPAVPENPASQNKTQLKAEAADPASGLQSDATAKENKLRHVLRLSNLKGSETVNVKQLATHELSVEQQLYYKEITEACVGSDEARRAEALQSLACDPGLHQMLPRLCTFIAEGVRVNVVQHNLAILIYLMRMVKSLLENNSLFLEKYLHELIPAVSTCIVSRQLCTRPDVDNHWALRDFASRLMANICKNFNTSTNAIQTRVTRMFSQGLQNDKAPLAAVYGAIAGLQELGPEVIKVFLLPHIKVISYRIDQATDPSMKHLGNAEKIAATHIKTLLVKSVSPVLKAGNGPEGIEEYKAEFGSLGTLLHGTVTRMRQASGQKSTPANTAARSSGGTQQRIGPGQQVTRINLQPQEQQQQQNTLFMHQQHLPHHD